MPKQLESQTYNHLPLNHCGLESHQGLWNLSCEEAIQLAYGTSAVILRCLFLNTLPQQLLYLHSVTSYGRETFRYVVRQINIPLYRTVEKDSVTSYGRETFCYILRQRNILLCLTVEKHSVTSQGREIFPYVLRQRNIPLRLTVELHSVTSYGRETFRYVVWQSYIPLRRTVEKHSVNVLRQSYIPLTSYGRATFR